MKGLSAILAFDIQLDYPLVVFEDKNCEVQIVELLTELRLTKQTLI